MTLVSGAGIWAYSRHKKEEDAKKQAWKEAKGKDNFVASAEKRTVSHLTLRAPRLLLDGTDQTRCSRPHLQDYYKQGGQAPPVK